ncbi:hypothetical protein [Isobaculum melis]|uniref:Uncharacterized protein n=1 Tax=Isobaculum melis TaxID=142588 RepID=A0A1H9UB76_9LACT|nr:hypothetical protein [Isobaculum melis]SES06427.1 hypothetical protein SAMN04488559_12518 [Isobaculum melis]
MSFMILGILFTIGLLAVVIVIGGSRLTKEKEQLQRKTDSNKVNRK